MARLPQVAGTQQVVCKTFSVMWLWGQASQAESLEHSRAEKLVPEVNSLETYTEGKVREGWIKPGETQSKVPENVLQCALARSLDGKVGAPDRG